MGSWKIIEISFPRIARISASESDRRSRPRKRMLPPTTRPGGEATSRRMLSAVTLLPLPDSPTTASVSPAWSVNDTPSTARTTPSSVKKWVWRSRTSSSVSVTSRLPSSFAPERPARIERVAQAVAEEVERHDREEDRAAGCEEHPGERRQHALAARGVQHVAPARGRGLHADAEEAQEHLTQDVARDRHGRGHDRERHRVRQDVAHDDPQARRPERLGREHVLRLPERQHHATDDPGEARPADERQDRDDREVGLLARQLEREHAAQRHDQVEAGDAQEQLGAAHDEHVDPAADVAAHAAEEEPERERDEDADDPDRERDLGAEEEPRPHVAPGVVGPDEEDAPGRIHAEEVTVGGQEAEQPVARAPREEPERVADRAVHRIALVGAGAGWAGGRGARGRCRSRRRARGPGGGAPCRRGGSAARRPPRRAGSGAADARTAPTANGPGCSPSHSWRMRGSAATSSTSATRLPAISTAEAMRTEPITRYWSCVLRASSVMVPSPGHEKMVSATNEPETG